MASVNTNKTFNFTRVLVAGLSLLFILTLGTLIIGQVIFDRENVEPWTLILNASLLSIPIALLYALIGVFSMAVYRHQHQQQITSRLAQFIYWSPRISCMVLVAFMSLFALDVFEQGRTLGEMLLGFLMHMLPMIALAVVLVFAWRWPWVGVVIFGLAAFAFLILIFTGGIQGLSTFLIFGAPLLMIALLFAVNALWNQAIDSARHPVLPVI